MAKVPVIEQVSKEVVCPNNCGGIPTPEPRRYDNYQFFKCSGCQTILRKNIQTGAVIKM